LDNDFVTDAYYRKKVSVAIDEIKTSLNKWQKALAITAPTQKAGFRVPKTVLS
jgi:hypothetical protein